MTSLHNAISILLVTSLALNALTVWRILRTPPIAFDVPFASEMPLPVEHAVLHFNFAKHYNITDDAEWATLLPANNGRIKLGVAQEEFDVGLFSDLACLENIRRAFLLLRDGAREPVPEAEACLGQMRQSIMCNAGASERRVRCRRQVRPSGVRRPCRPSVP
ncbi:hypothetical protein MSAN_01327400 [Mycena sanguinolenta]|uniref:Uncharacterized protein n=1 Tax=Mycena sanguinolenta TaxID=230812 RepID=A0A8H6YAB0_9AGAR|nr:hypothetical protein MSAN_01327400 [Mycena sanguinolenta]